MGSVAPEVSESAESAPAFQYVALTTHKVVRDGELVVVLPGESIPEAEEWSPLIRDRYEQESRIARVAVVARGRGRPKKGDS